MDVSALELLVGLLIAVVPLVALARRLDIAYPIVLVLGGIALSFIPGLPALTISPTVVLYILLPPLLYWEAITAPTHTIRQTIWSITPLAVGLVIATAAATAATARYIIPGLSWAAAFVLGAIVAPTDEAAFLPLVSRLNIPRHTVAIIEGESLLNDATALVLFSVAVGAVSSAHPSLLPALWKLAWASAGAVVLGVIIGRAAAAGWAQVRDPQLQGVISLTLPYLAYLPADRIGVSGVLTAVTVGLVVGRRTPRFLTPRARIQLVGYYETVIFIITVVIFLAVGLQLRTIMGVLERSPRSILIRDALVVSAVVIGTRLVWVAGQLATTVLIRQIRRYRARNESESTARPTDWRTAVVTAWTGLRGGISLAAALAIPTMTRSGAPFPYRDLFIFLAYAVILITLVGQGLTLPPLIRRLGLVDDGTEAREEAIARRAIAQAALKRLDALERDETIPRRVIALLRRRYERRARVATLAEWKRARTGEHTSAKTRLGEVEAYERVVRDLLAAQLEALLELDDRGEIDNTVMRRTLEWIDLELLQLERSRVRHHLPHAITATHSAGPTSRPT